jgi:RHS repeat-associated protein
MVERSNQVLLWDIENRLASVSENGTTTATFVCDGDGKRVKKTEGGQTILYVNQFYEVNLTSGNVTSSYYLGGKLIATLEQGVSENGTLRYVHQDSLSSTSLMTDSVGAQIDTTVKYLPFGEVRITVDIPTDKLFTGQRLDGTGLYYYSARYYDATIGRFISPDTVVQSPADPQCFNRYSYCLNNPLRYVDPTGQIVCIKDNDQELQASWDLFASIFPDIAQLLLDSDITYTFQWGDAAGALATTDVTGKKEGVVTDVSITLDKGRINPSREGIIGIGSVMSHEIVHCLVYNFTHKEGYDSQYEEAVAMTFQDKFNGITGYKPSHRWYDAPGWPWCWLTGGTGPERGQKIVNQVKKYVLLSREETSALRGSLTTAFSNTTYENYPWFDYFSMTNTDYWALWNKILDTLKI